MSINFILRQSAIAWIAFFRSILMIYTLRTFKIVRALQENLKGML